MLQLQYNPGQSGYARGCFQMPNICLDRSKRAGPRRERSAERRGQSGDFDRVSERGAGPVGFDVGHRGRIYRGSAQGRGDDVALQPRVRDCIAIRLTTMVGGPTAYDGMDVVSICNSC